MTPAGRVEELARALDSPRAPASLDDDLRPFLELAVALRSVESAPAPLEFRESLRHRLMSEALAVEAHPVIRIATPPATPSRDTTWSRVARALAAAVGTFVVLAMFGSATLRAVPGDLLYGVKRQAEAIELMAVRDELGRGHALLARAERRLDEIRTLAERRDRGRIAKTMADMDRATSRGSALLMFVATKTGQLQPLVDLEEFTVRQQQGLAEITALLSTDEIQRAAQSARLLLAIQESTHEAMAQLSCTVGCDAVQQQPAASTTQPSPSSQSPSGPSARIPGAGAPPGTPVAPALPVGTGGGAVSNAGSQAGSQAGSPALPPGVPAPPAAALPTPAAPAGSSAAATAQGVVGGAAAEAGATTTPPTGVQVPPAPLPPGMTSPPAVPPPISSPAVVAPPAPRPPAPPTTSPPPPPRAPPPPPLPPPPSPPPLPSVSVPPAPVVTTPLLPAPLPSVSVTVTVPPPPSPPGLPPLP